MKFTSAILLSTLSMVTLPAFAAESLFITNNTTKNIQGKIISPFSIAPGSKSTVPFANDNMILNSRRGMRLNPKALEANELSITLSDGGQVIATKTNRYNTYSGSTVWIGKSIKNPVGSNKYVEDETILVLRNGRITGTVLHAGKMYKIKSAANGEHTLARINTNLSIPDHDERSLRNLPRIIPTFATRAKQPNNSAKPEIAEYDQEKYRAKTVPTDNRNLVGTTEASALATSYPPVVRVLVNYTPSAKWKLDDVVANVDQFIAQTNSIFENSRINLRVTLAHLEPVSYAESGDINKDLAHYSSTNDNYMDEIHTQRSLRQADLAILLTYETTPKSAGLAYMNSTTDLAFGVVDAFYAQTQYSFAHEIAHIFSAGHTDDTPAPAKAYGHGFATGTSQNDLRSVMAKPTNTTDRSRRANFFSNPILSTVINGANVTIGTIDKNDNARVLNEDGTRVSQFLPPPTTFPQNRDWYLIENKETLPDFGIVEFNKAASGVREPYSKANTPSLFFSDFIVNLQMGAQTKKVSPATLNTLIELYIAFMNRVPDADGIYYWTQKSAEGATINQIAESFYASAVLFSEQTGYSATMTNEAFIRIVYKNVLGRNEVDQEGLNYWMTALANGSQTRGSLVTTILSAAHTFKGDAQYGWVADLLDNKVYVGKYFSVKQGLSYKMPEDNITNGKAIAAAVTSTDTSAAIARIGIRDTAFDSTK